MCGAPERLTPFGARNFLILSPEFITIIMDHKVQLVKPLNLRELYTT
jgi:hypothetical protein